MHSLFCRPKKLSLGNETGFTLTEVMIALAIFVIGIVGCYQLQIRSTRTNVIANSVGAAATWATYVVEEMVAKDIDDPALLDDDDDGTPGAGGGGLDETEGDADGVLYIRPDGSAGDAAGANDIYSVSWNVVDNEDSPEETLAGTKKIRLIVTKRGGIGSGVLYTQDYFKTDANL